MKIHVFWDMTPCHWARVSYLSEDCRVFFSKSNSWKTKVLLGSLGYEDECTMILKTLATACPTTLHHTPRSELLAKLLWESQILQKGGVWILIQINGSNSLASKRSNDVFKLWRYLLSVCFCADVLHDMGHSYLQLICNGCYPWVVLHLENRLVAY